MTQNPDLNEEYVLHMRVASLFEELQRKQDPRYEEIFTMMYKAREFFKKNNPSEYDPNPIKVFHDL